MGVPGLLKYYCQKHKVIFRNNLTERPEFLYIDANCLFHEVANEYNRTDENVLKTEKKMDREIIAAIVQKIEALSQEVDAEKIFIAVDGAVPDSKIRQQRLRRFKSIKDSELLDKYLSKYPEHQFQKKWLNLKITPATQFMDDLMAAILKYSKTKYGVIFSPYTEPMEGEHKILQHIRQNETKNSIIYGADGDFLFLALDYDTVHIHITRRDMNNVLTYIDVNILRQEVINLIHEHMPKTVDIAKLNSKSLLRDFIVICMFLGNDFLPRLPSLDIYKNGIDILVSIYGRIYQGTYLLDNKLQINQDMLVNIFSELEKLESDFFTPSFTRPATCPYSDPYHARKWEIENLHHVKVTDPIGLGLGHSDNWKYKYYEFYYGASGNQKKFIQSMCNQYMRGIVWNISYYLEDCVSWSWQYPYHNAPFVSDMLSFLKEFNVNNYAFKLDQPLEAEKQLMIVLPNQATHLLPSTMRRYREKNTKIKHLFPEEIELDYLGQKLLWKCIPQLIPFSREFFSQRENNVD